MNPIAWIMKCLLLREKWGWVLQNFASFVSTTSANPLIKSLRMHGCHRQEDCWITRHLRLKTLQNDWGSLTAFHFPRHSHDIIISRQPHIENISPETVKLMCALAQLIACHTSTCIITSRELHGCSEVFSITWPRGHSLWPNPSIKRGICQIIQRWNYSVHDSIPDVREEWGILLSCGILAWTLFIPWGVWSRGWIPECSK